MFNSVSLLLNTLSQRKCLSRLQIENRLPSPFSDPPLGRGFAVMDELMRSSAELEDVTELMQRIQLRMPAKEAARTSVLSKSWLHAWSTIPTLRFRVGRNDSMKLVDVDRTMARYLRDNIPIEKFHLVIDLENQESASHAENWIRHVGAKTCLKKLTIRAFLSRACITLPDEILSGENLTKIRVSSATRIQSVLMTTRPVIKCVSLRELYLEYVHISEKVFDEILSSCSLLVKIELLHSCKGFKAIKVKNLPCLRELRMELDEQDSTALEISHVPNLRVFSWDLQCTLPHWNRRPQLLCPFNAHSISLGSNVKQLTLGGVITDKPSLEKITSGLPFLKSLTLRLTSWTLESFSFTCAPIRSLTLLWCPSTLTNIQVYAPKLHFFSLRGCSMPNLTFPISTLMEIKLSVRVGNPIDASFFIKMREALMLSRTCCLDIITSNNQRPLDIDIDDLRTRLPFPPAMNVQQVSFQTEHDKECAPFFDAFFEICHPKLVSAKQNNHFCTLMLREVLEKNTTGPPPHWLHYLKRVQMKRPHHRKWETLTNSHTSFLDGSVPSSYVDFKLNWR